MNSCTFSGNLTRKPRLSYTAKGQAVSTFTIAVNNYHGEETTFVDCVYWGPVPGSRAAESGTNMAEIFAGSQDKGDRVGVIGRLVPRSYEGKDNIMKKKTELQVQQLELTKKPNGNGNGNVAADDAIPAEG
jgi:single-stranded DNA-binding protein